MTTFLIFSVLIGIAFNIFLFFLDKKEQYVKAYNPKTNEYEHIPMFSFRSDTRWKVLMISGFVPFLNIAFLALMLIDIVGYLRK
ncbi:putative membrane protein [Xanthomonas phage XbC2]|nr:putative membrane protein [Xanthomonas phage XbC2]